MYINILLSSLNYTCFHEKFLVLLNVNISEICLLTVCYVYVNAAFIVFRKYRVWMQEKLPSLCLNSCLTLPISIAIHFRYFRYLPINQNSDNIMITTDISWKNLNSNDYARTY